MNDNDVEGYLLKVMGRTEFILTGLSKAELRVQLFDTLQEFFDESNVWQENIPFTAIPTLLDYQLDPISGRIMRLSNVLDQNNVPQQCVMPVPGWVHFLYPYDNPTPVQAIVVKNVDEPLECFPPDFPGWILKQYNLAIQSGMLGSLMSQPGQSYSNDNMGVYHLKRFRNAKDHARVAQQRLNTIGAQAWAYPQQYRTTTQRGGVSTFNVNPAPMPPR